MPRPTACAVLERDRGVLVAQDHLVGGGRSSCRVLAFTWETESLRLPVRARDEREDGPVGVVVRVGV